MTPDWSGFEVEAPDWSGFEAHGNHIELIDLQDEDVGQLIDELSRDVRAPHLYEELS